MGTPVLLHSAISQSRHRSQTQPTCTQQDLPSPLLPAPSLSAARLLCAPWQLPHSVASRLPQQIRTLTLPPNSLVLVLPLLVLQDLVLVGSVFGSLIIGYARNPSLKQQLFSYAILGFALSE